MANEDVQHLRPRDFVRESTTGNDGSLSLAATGDMMGLVFPKLANQGYTSSFVVPAELTMATGLTFLIFVTDDGTNAADLGKVARFGITVKRIVSGTDSTDIDTGAATEATVDITLSSTSGVVVAGSIAIAAAALDSIVVGNYALIRVRRIADHANDTCNGRVLSPLGVYIKNT